MICFSEGGTAMKSLPIIISMCTQLFMRVTDLSLSLPTLFLFSPRGKVPFQVASLQVQVSTRM